MKPEHQVGTEDCRRISEILSRVGDKWTVLVVTYLGERTLRFSELRRQIGGISQKMLTTTLRNLERDGFVERVVYPTTPPSVEYSLTPLGRELQVPVEHLGSWARANTHRIDQARADYDRKKRPERTAPETA